MCCDETVDSPSRLWQRLQSSPRRRDAAGAAATAALGIVLIWLGMVDIVRWGQESVAVPSGLESRWWHSVPLLLGCAALLGKRRRPEAVAVAAALLTALDIGIGGSVGLYVVLADALYSLTLYTREPRIRPSMTAIAIPILAAPLAIFVVTGSLPAAVMMLLQAFALLGTPVWWGLSVRRQAQLAALASARVDDLQRLAQLQRGQVVRDERTRMAQDLHDALSSDLSTIAIHSEAALSGAAGAPDAPTGRALAEIRSSSVRALEDLRQMILLLQTDQDHITPAAHVADVGPLVDSARTTGLRVRVAGDPESLPILPSAVDHAGYRIVQESLANATKHAPGGDVTVSLRSADGALCLQVASRAGDVTGSSPLGSGLGLRTMEDRTRTLGGTFSAGWDDNGEERTWVVAAELPLEEVGPT